jgi:DNA polymerase elongation subunit (family B)
MGIVLKRRDNAPIVKYVFGNVIEMIMVEKDFEKVKTWLVDTLRSICKGTDFDLMYFVITKALRGYYKNPRQIAHKVLADRMAERDPGNKPKANDRIAYAYIKLDDTVEFDHSNPYKSGIRKGHARENAILQGDRIEHVDYIKARNLELDYQLYITNQIMNPVKQVLDLRMDPKESEALFAEFLKKAPIAEKPVSEPPVAGAQNKL